MNLLHNAFAQRDIWCCVIWYSLKRLMVNRFEAIAIGKMTLKHAPFDKFTIDKFELNQFSGWYEWREISHELWVVSWLQKDGLLVDFDWNVQWNSQVECSAWHSTRFKSVKITGTPGASLRAEMKKLSKAPAEWCCLYTDWNQVEPSRRCHRRRYQYDRSVAYLEICSLGLADPNVNCI